MAAVKKKKIAARNMASKHSQFIKKTKTIVQFLN